MWLPSFVQVRLQLPLLRVRSSKCRDKPEDCQIRTPETWANCYLRWWAPRQSGIIWSCIRDEQSKFGRIEVLDGRAWESRWQPDSVLHCVVESFLADPFPIRSGQQSIPLLQSDVGGKNVQVPFQQHRQWKRSLMVGHRKRSVSAFAIGAHRYRSGSSERPNWRTILIFATASWEHLDYACVVLPMPFWSTQ